MKRNNSELIKPISSLRKKSGHENTGWNIVATHLLRKPPGLMSIRDRGIAVDFDASHTLLNGIKRSITADIDSQIKEQINKTLSFMNRLKSLGIDVMTLPDEQLIELTVCGQDETQLNTTTSREVPNRNKIEGSSLVCNEKHKDHHMDELELRDLTIRNEVFEKAIDNISSDIQNLKDSIKLMDIELKEKDQNFEELIDQYKELTSSVLSKDKDIRVIESNISWYENEIKAYEEYNKQKDNEIQQKINDLNDQKNEYERRIFSLNNETNIKADDLLSLISKNLEKKMKIDEKESAQLILNKKIKEHQTLRDEYKKKLDSLEPAFEKEHEQYHNLLKQKVKEEERYFAYKVKEDFLKEAISEAATSFSNTEAINFITMDNVLHSILQKIDRIEHRDGFLSTISNEQRSQLNESCSLQLELKEAEYRESVSRDFEMKELLTGAMKEAFENQNQVIQSILEIRLKAMIPEPPSELTEKIFEKLIKLQETIISQQQRPSISRLEVPTQEFNDRKSIFDRKRYLESDCPTQQITLNIPSPIQNRSKHIKQSSLYLPNSSKRRTNLEKVNNTIDDMSKDGDHYKEKSHDGESSNGESDDGESNHQNSGNENRTNSENSLINLKSPTHEMNMNMEELPIGIDGTDQSPKDLQNQSIGIPQMQNLKVLGTDRQTLKTVVESKVSEPAEKVKTPEKNSNSLAEEIIQEQKTICKVIASTQTAPIELDEHRKMIAVPEPDSSDRRQAEPQNMSMSRISYEDETVMAIYQTINHMLRLSSMFSNTLAKMVIRSQQTQLKQLISE